MDRITKMLDGVADDVLRHGLHVFVLTYVRANARACACACVWQQEGRGRFAGDGTNGQGALTFWGWKTKMLRCSAGGCEAVS